VCGRNARFWRTVTGCVILVAAAAKLLLIIIKH
jgi:hypothetical protein